MKTDALQPIREALYVDDTNRPADVLAGMIRDLFRVESKRCDEIRTLRAENARLRAALETLITACDERGGRIRTVHRVDVDTARTALDGAR